MGGHRVALREVERRGREAISHNILELLEASMPNSLPSANVHYGVWV